MSADEHPFLPPTLEFLVISLKTQAEAALGLIRFSEDPEEQPREPNFRVARHAIDTLAMLQEKTKGNLAWEEERLMHNTLTELLLKFATMRSGLPSPFTSLIATESGTKPVAKVC